MKTMRTMVLVLKAANMNDNDKLMTFFSPDYGRLTAIAKGVRSHKHKDFAALQPFCFSNITLNCKESGLYTVASASVANSFFDLRNDVLKVAYATYYMDVISDISQEIVGDEDYFTFVLNTLYLTEKINVNDDIDSILKSLNKLKAIFEIKTAWVMGVMPEVNKCIHCGKDKNLNFFSPEDGGAVCADCVGRYVDYAKLPVSFTEMDRKIIDYILNCDNRTVFKFDITEELLNSLCIKSEKHLIAQTETYYKSLEFLHKMIEDCSR